MTVWGRKCLSELCQCPWSCKEDVSWKEFHRCECNSGLGVCQVLLRSGNKMMKVARYDDLVQQLNHWVHLLADKAVLKWTVKTFWSSWNTLGCLLILYYSHFSRIRWTNYDSITHFLLLQSTVLINIWILTFLFGDPCILVLTDSFMEEAKEKKRKKMFQKYCNQKKTGSIVTKNILIVPQWNLTPWNELLSKTSTKWLWWVVVGGAKLDRIRLNWLL